MSIKIFNPLLSKLIKIIFCSSLLGLTVTLSGCSPDKKEDPKSDSLVRALWSEATPEAGQIKVVNQFGEPVVQAKILIGSAQNNPFRGNFIETDKAGKVQIPKEWTSPAHVTVDADGYIRQTLLNQKPGNMTLKLNTSYLAQKAELRGQVTNLPIVNMDKLIDFGLVMPALSRGDILNFDLDLVISPLTDVLSVAGQKADLPSNVSLPTQKENYIFNLTVSKPVYRLMVPTLGPKRFFAARGRFPFKAVVDELRDGKPFYELLNYFSILGGGIRDTTLVNPSTTLDIPGIELEFKNTVQVQSAQTNSDEVLMMLAASDVAGSMIPTDVKKTAPSQSITLNSMADKPTYIVSVIKKQSEFMTRTPGSDRMSASLMTYKLNEKQKLLPLVADPTIETTDAYLIHLPVAPNTEGINSIATSAVISDLVDSVNGTNKITSVNRRWEILGLGWSKDIQLPKWPLSQTPNRKRVEINFIGSVNKPPVNLDDSIIEAATHVSHASTDF
jgi:hypothetical protein